MNKRKILLIILLLIVIILGILNIMWLQDLKEDNTELNFNTQTPEINKPGIRIIHMTTHQDRIYPYTIEAKVGDILIIDFASVNATELEVQGHDVSQRVKLYSIDLTLNKKGIFEYYCLNCNQKAPGLLIVN